MHDDDNIGGSHRLRGEQLQVGRAWSGENILFGLVRFFWSGEIPVIAAIYILISHHTEAPKINKCFQILRL